MPGQYVVALDLGTTGNRAIAFSKEGRIAASAYAEFSQKYPKPAWVEQDPLEILQSTMQSLKAVAKKIGVNSIVTIGITNQRETTIIWNKNTGQPIYNAIGWQCRRTTAECHALKDKSDWIKQKTGLFPDPYFSATKIQWLLDNVPQARAKAEAGELLFGTVDTWILWNLSKQKHHYTEASNASRTMLFNIVTAKWDRELLKLFNIPQNLLPEVKDSAADFGVLESSILGKEIPITGILGDQQAALFAQGGWDDKVVKNTYGTGLFVVTTTDHKIPPSGKLINTIAWQQKGKITYALEGSIFTGGSAIQWLRDGLKIIDNATETEAIAKTLTDNEGVYFVPALVGLGAPYWDPDARGMFLGLTRGSKRSHMVRATLESLAYQTRDVIEEINKICPEKNLTVLRVDGGAIKNNFLMQFQADILGLKVERPEVAETTAFGAAGIAGIYAGFWTEAEFLKARHIESSFNPSMPVAEQTKYYKKWQQAVLKSLKWAE